ncbi:MAG: hypothetical protein R3C20_20485 [Planctomycetaceae bacterium]
MPKRPRDDSTGAGGDLGTRLYRQHAGVTVDAVFGEGTRGSVAFASLASFPRHCEYAVFAPTIQPGGLAEISRWSPPSGAPPVTSPQSPAS